MFKIDIADRLKNLPSPATIAMSERARELESQGKSVISLCIGQPDFPSSEEAFGGAVLEIEEGRTGYPPIPGQRDLLERIAQKMKKENGLDVSTDELIVCNGAKQVIFNAFYATINDGDEVIIPSPYWVSYPLIPIMLGGHHVDIQTKEEDRFFPRADALRKAITPKTKWLVLNYPNNPTGAIATREDMEKIADVLREFPHVMIMSDEIYEHLVFDGHKSVTLYDVAPDLRERIMIINGMSKAYAMTGWRVGFGCGPKELIRAMAKVQGNTTSGICTLAQGGAKSVLDAVLNDEVDRRNFMCQTYQRRRDKVVSYLKGIDGLTCAIPEGAFYAYPGIKKLLGKTTPAGTLLKTDADFSKAFLDECYVATVPGSSFGCAPYLRLSFATSDEHLEEACKRLKEFVLSLK